MQTQEARTATPSSTLQDHPGGGPTYLMVLRRMSNETNVRLAEVAAALVHRAQQRGLGGLTA